jgi:tRNA(adenine34) deaminase
METYIATVRKSYSCYGIGKTCEGSLLDLDRTYMSMALRLAVEAAEEGEVPVGAIAVKDGRILGKGRNRTESLHDPTAHAEMEAITAAANTLGDKRLDGVTLYVTLEPCPMCTGALVLARVERVVYAADDPKAGACGSLMRLHDDPRLNHQFIITAGVMAEEAGVLLQQFFSKLRIGNSQTTAGNNGKPQGGETGNPEQRPT